MEWPAKSFLPGFCFASPASARTSSRSIVTQASSRGSISSIRASNRRTYSTGEKSPDRMPAAASIRERSSRFIFELYRHGAELPEIVLELHDLLPEFLCPCLSYFFRGFFEQVHWKELDFTIFSSLYVCT